MINKLIEEIIARLRSGFNGVISNPDNHIEAGPISPPGTGALPKIALYAGGYEINQTVRDDASSQPRPQPITQIIPVNVGTPQGPYSLSKTPLQGTLRCKIIFNKGAVDERKLTLQENADFTTDYSTAEVLFNTSIEEADEIVLDYSFVGVYTLREFQQSLLLDVYAASVSESEQLAALSSSMILTQQNELLDHFNVVDPTEYIANQYVTKHSLDRIDLMAGAPETQSNVYQYQSTFQVHGQIKYTKAIVDGFGLIEKVHSPGVDSEHPVDIEVNLD